MLIEAGRRSSTAGAAGAGGCVGAGGGGGGVVGAGGGLVGLGVGFGVGLGVGLGVGARVGVGVEATTCVGVGDGTDFATVVDEPQAANRLLRKAIQRTVKSIFARIPPRMRPDTVNNWRTV